MTEISCARAFALPLATPIFQASGPTAGDKKGFCAMSPEERQMLTELFERVRSQAGAPRDHDAENFIADSVRAQPYAPYLFAQAVLIQEQALKGADQKIKDLEARLAQAQAQAQPQPAPQGGGSFLGGLFGGGAPRQQQQPPAPGPSLWGQQPPQQPPQQPSPWGGPQQQAAPAQQPSPWGAPPAAPGGGGFLKGALGAAAGVAGGVLLADSLKGMFGGGHSGGGGLFGGGQSAGLLGDGAGRETVVNNYYENPQGNDGGRDSGYQNSDYQDDGDNSGDDYSSDA
jgi:hypothetical protein